MDFDCFAIEIQFKCSLRLDHVAGVFVFNHRETHEIKLFASGGRMLQERIGALVSQTKTDFKMKCTRVLLSVTDFSTHVGKV